MGPRLTDATYPATTTQATTTTSSRMPSSLEDSRASFRHASYEPPSPDADEVPAEKVRLRYFKSLIDF